MQPLKIRPVRLNFALNNTRLLLNLLVPLIVFPYISRILGPEGLGKVEFANSIVSYFALFTSLGIPTYGVREIARRRDDPAERSKVVWELTLVLAVTIGIGYAVYAALVRFVPLLYKGRALFCVIAPAIALSGFSYEWFYGGIEDQVYITVRFIAAKVIQLLLVFLCVRKAGDCIIYAGIAVGLGGFSALFNIARLKRYVHFVPLAQLNIRRHIKPVFIIFVSNVAVNVYMQLDVTMVGLMVGDTAVGLYTAANRIVRMAILAVTSLAVVMIPRIENALRKGDVKSYKTYLDTSLRFILLFGVPCCFGIIMLAPEIILLLAGEKYTESILSVKLLSIIIIIVGLANFVGLQVLYPNRKEKLYTIAVSVSAAVNAVFNFIMIPVLKQNGAILGTVLAELTGLLIQIFFAWKLLRDTELFSWNTLKYFIAGIGMIIIIAITQKLVDFVIVSLVLSFVFGGIFYLGVIILLRKQTVIRILNGLNKV
jgi:O-antigen/teichoic acid export membrane protein